MHDDLLDPTQAHAFTFGDPTPVLDGRDFGGMFQSTFNGRYYEPPINLDGLAKARHANVHHASAMEVKTDILVSCFKPHKMLSRRDFHQLAMDYVHFGNAYVELIPNQLGQAWKTSAALAKFCRVKRNGQYLFLRDYGQEHDFADDSVFHFRKPDIDQEIYGVPSYMAALQSALLNESATLFRRKYYLNGSHAGFILHMTDALQKPEDVDAIRGALKQAKGPGNFRNMLIYTPGGSKDGIKVIPIAEIAAKDEFFNIKNITRDDCLAAHRVPPQLMSIIPTNTGGLGLAKAAAEVFARNELQPLMSVFQDLNYWLGEEVVKFDPYVIEAGADSVGPGEGKDVIR